MIPVKHGSCLLGHYLNTGDIEPLNANCRAILESMFTCGYEIKNIYHAGGDLIIAVEIYKP